MIDIFGIIKNRLQENRKIPSKTLINLNPSSQVCYSDIDGSQLGSCLRQVWLEKTDQEKTNPIGLNAVMAGALGNDYEEWLINQLKETGLYYNSGISFTDTSRVVKGIVDVIIKDPNTGELCLGEIKSYDGSNYTNSSLIIGNSKNKPKPRDKNLLQLMRYMLIGLELGFKTGYLIYVDRACNYYKNKQFKIELVNISGKNYPKISTTDHLGEYYEYTDMRICDTGIYEAEDKLLQHLGSNAIPDKEFVEEYDEETVHTRFEAGLIPDYLYNKWKRDPMNNPLGDFQCKYCPFYNGTCKNWS